MYKNDNGINSSAHCTPVVRIYASSEKYAHSKKQKVTSVLKVSSFVMTPAANNVHSKLIQNKRPGIILQPKTTYIKSAYASVITRANVQLYVTCEAAPGVSEGCAASPV